MVSNEVTEANEALASVLVDQVRVRLRRVVELETSLSPRAANALSALDAIELDDDKTPSPSDIKKHTKK
jgi:hypothetical protein